MINYFRQGSMNTTIKQIAETIFSKRIFIVTILFLAIPVIHLKAQNRTWLIDTLNQYVLAQNQPFNIQPGDTVFIQAGRRSRLQIKNIAGTALKPVIIINKGGVVTISTENQYGISLHNCRYFKLTGTGDKNSFYGIQIKRVALGAGLGIGMLSSDYEIDHISIENCYSAGIYAKSDPDCNFTSTRENFTQYNTSIHDCYVDNVAFEGMYIGNTTYNGQTVNCNGKDTLLLPSLLKGVRVYNNIIKYSGWDGIQVSSASEDCQIYNNLILYDSQAEYNFQMSGILLGGGSKCDCYNNYISHGKGEGIESHGLGGNRIFNNIIVDPGRNYLPLDPSKMKHGIFVSDASTLNDSSYFIMFNTIVNPKSDGIRFQSVKSKKSVIASNLIVNPGNFDLYENDNTSLKGQDSYIMLPSSTSDVLIRNNYLTRNISDAMVADSTFAILSGSPLINAAYSNSMGINFDFANFRRPTGLSSDIGAMEFNPEIVAIFNTDSDIIAKVLAYPNPVKSILNIKYPSKLPSPLLLNIYSVQGTIVLQEKYESLAGEEGKIVANVGTLNEGIYFYSIKSGREILSGKFLRIK
jgi:hypothetical protein